MPETTKTYADMEILQGADYDMTLTLDSATANKSYMMTVRKDYTGSSDFSGSSAGAGTSANPYRTEIYETDQSTIGKLTASDSGTTYTVAIKLYAQWTETLDDSFDGKWEMVEKSGTSYLRIAQGDIYLNNSASRYASISSRSD